MELAMALRMARKETIVRLPRRGSVLLLVAMAILALSLGSVVTALRSVERLRPRGRNDLEAAERRVAKVGRKLDEMRRREHLGGWIQQEIQRANPRLDPAKAREYGRLLLTVTEKFVSDDPIFLLAIGIVESRFTERATSHAEAKGLYQIWPATGRWLAADLGWEFSEAMLYEPAKNTELAACYLDKLFETYGDPRLVLAEYNGGPLNARRLRNGSHLVRAETRDYVVKVMAVVEDLHRRLDIPAANHWKSREPVRMVAVGAARAGL
jgi:soluble lytic murein transglycosylase-like protein